MEKDKLFYVGYDMNDSAVQITWTSGEDIEPIPIEYIAGKDQYYIPLVLTKRKNVGQWYYGLEAQKVAESKEGFKIEHLLHLFLNQEEVTIEETQYKTLTLLVLFIRRTLVLFSRSHNFNNLGKIVFTVEKMENKYFEVIRSLEESMPILKNKIMIQENKESFYHYLYHQSKELWSHSVFLFECTASKLVSYEMIRNTRTKPQLVQAEEVSYPEFLSIELGSHSGEEHIVAEKKDLAFLAIIEKAFEKKVVSAVYLLGEGFDGGWMKSSIKSLCRNRRVFQGKNLYTKGAAYGAMADFSENQRNLLYLGKDKLWSNIGSILFYGGQEQYYPLLSAGVNWYEAHKECTILLDNTNEIGFYIGTVDGKSKVLETLVLDGLPKRDNKTVKLKLIMKMTSCRKIEILVEDVGFGEFFPNTGKVWEFQITLKLEENNGKTNTM